MVLRKHRFENDNHKAANLKDRKAWGVRGDGERKKWREFKRKGKLNFLFSSWVSDRVFKKSYCKID